MANQRTAFNAEDIQAFLPAEKIGIVASVNPDGLPHITLITSIRANNERQLTLGEFCRGNSKAFIQENPNITFMALTMDKRMWRGTARWTQMRKDGPEYQSYNDLPMFRYNAYFGINTVHYLDLVSVAGPMGLPIPRILLATLMTRFSRGALTTGSKDQILKPFAENLFNQLGTLKFLSYIGADGFPVLIPLLQCQAVDSRRLVFSPIAYPSELFQIPAGQTVAVFCLSMKMEDVLVRGTFNGFSKHRMIHAGTVDISWVYNSMPPAHGQIYPQKPLEPVTEWPDFPRKTA